MATDAGGKQTPTVTGGQMKWMRHIRGCELFSRPYKESFWFHKEPLSKCLCCHRKHFTSLTYQAGEMRTSVQLQLMIKILSHSSQTQLACC